MQNYGDGSLWSLESSRSATLLDCGGSLIDTGLRELISAGGALSRRISASSVSHPRILRCDPGHRMDRRAEVARCEPHTLISQLLEPASSKRTGWDRLVSDRDEQHC